MSWTEERVDVLKKLWAEGLSASQIAARLGGITRNAVIGKVNRLGLSGRVTVSRLKARRNAKTKPRTVLRNPLVKQFNFGSGIPATPIEKIIQRPNPQTGVKFIDRHQGQCKYIYGDPRTDEHCVCPNEREPGLAYCKECAAHVYTTIGHKLPDYSHFTEDRKVAPGSGVLRTSNQAVREGAN